MPWDREKEDQSTWKPLTPDQQEELRRRHQEPALREVGVTEEINRQGRKQPEMPRQQRERPTTPPPAERPTLH